MGVYAPLTGMIGTLQACEGLKLLGDFGTAASGRLLMIDSLTLALSTVRIAKDPACTVCAGGRPPVLPPPCA